MRYATLLIVLLLGAGLAQAQDVPKRKSGLWEITRTTSRTEGKPRLTQWCVEEKSDNAVKQLAEGGRNEVCKIDKQAREGDRLVIDASCNIGESRIHSKTHAVISGKFDSAYKVESKSTYDPPMRGKSEGTAVLDAKWVGACKPGMKPGDVILDNGMKFSTTEEGKKEAQAAEAKASADAKATDAKAKRGQSQAPAYKPAPPAPTK